jgi:leucyl aminopeptidase
MSLIVGVQTKGQGLAGEAKSVLAEIAESPLVLKTKWDLGKARLSYLNNSKYDRVVLVGLGDELKDANDVDLKSQDTIEETVLTPTQQKPYKQNNKVKIEEQFGADHGDWSFVIADKVREAVKEAVKLLLKDDRKNTTQITVDTLLAGQQFEQQVVEGAFLGTYEFALPDSEQFDNDDNDHPRVNLSPLNGKEDDTWTRGRVYAQSQIVAALVSEMPANLMTPTIFAEYMKERFNGLKNVKVDIHNREWAQKLEV